MNERKTTTQSSNDLGPRMAVVTGATSGLGRAAAEALAQQGFGVLLVGRDRDRGAEVVEAIRAAGGQAELVLGDLLTVAGAQAVAASILARTPRIDLLINNAGGAFRRLERTADGLERTFALNVLAPFVLTESLLPALEAARGRVVNVVTGVPPKAKTTIEAIAGEQAKPGMQSYIRNKLALVTLTIELQRRYGARGISFASLHPGIVPNTRFGSEMPGWMLKLGPVVAKLLRLASPIDAVAERYVKVSTEAVEQGGFYYEGALRPAPVQAQDPAFAASLHATLEGLVS
ncbi:MAG: SDR family NAD(P)-dependent oxidoreductase [Myxococcales bacterium]|nr:SDR family NAD(P)-dependent oxidoreductase [Myxococcales bacterium]